MNILSVVILLLIIVFYICRHCSGGNSAATVASENFYLLNDQLKKCVDSNLNEVPLKPGACGVFTLLSRANNKFTLRSPKGTCFDNSGNEISCDSNNVVIHDKIHVFNNAYKFDNYNLLNTNPRSTDTFYIVNTELNTCVKDDQSLINPLKTDSQCAKFTLLPGANNKYAFKSSNGKCMGINNTPVACNSPEVLYYPKTSLVNNLYDMDNNLRLMGV